MCALARPALDAGQRLLTKLLQLKMAFNVSAKPLLPSSLHGLSQFFPCAVILQECVVSEDCSLAFLKGPETTQDAGQLTLHPVLQVLLYDLLTDGLGMLSSQERHHEFL